MTVQDLFSNFECFVSPSTRTLIDGVRDGRTWIHGETLDQVRLRYPDAVVMKYDDFATGESAAMRGPFEWTECTKEQYEEALCCLPPEMWWGGGFVNGEWEGGGFLVGEVDNHDPMTGEGFFQAYRRVGDRCYWSTRCLTRKEFAEQVGL